LTNENQQVRLATYRTWPDFHVSSIGSDWQKHHAELERGSPGRIRLGTAALWERARDRSVIRARGTECESKNDAISALVWGGSQEEITRLLVSGDNETFRAILHEIVPGSHSRSNPSTRPSSKSGFVPREHRPGGAAAGIVAYCRSGRCECHGELKEELNRCPRGTLEQFGRYVTKHHPLRPIRTMVDEILKQLSPRFNKMYAKVGRPSIPPEQLLRAQLLQLLYSVRSERLLMEEMDWFRLYWRWKGRHGDGRRRYLRKFAISSVK
jgi:hypothetical protein